MEYYVDQMSGFDNNTEKAITSPEKQHGINLHWHASHGDLKSIKHMVMKGYYDPSQQNEHGNTALHCAAQSGHLPLVKYFIEILRFNVYQKNRQDQSLLHLASISCCTQLVKYLLSMSCFDLYDKDRFNAVPLHYACGLGNYEISKILIEKMTESIGLKKMLVQTSLYQANQLFNPFHIAIGRGQANIVHYFISELDHNCSNDEFSLMLSVKHSQVLQFLLHTQNFSSDAKHLAFFMAVNTVCVDAVNFINVAHHCKLPDHVSMQNLPLHLAVKHGDLEKIEYIAKTAKVDWNEVTIGRRTLLHHACLEGHLHIVKYLLEEKNVLISQDKNKSSPLHLACISGNVQLVEYLIDLKKPEMDLLSKDLYQNTPLHIASIDGRLDEVKLFLDIKKLDPNLKGSLGMTPLHCACHYNFFSLVQYLIDTWDCDPLCKDDDSRTPLYLAVLSGHLEIVKYLTKNWNILPLDPDDKYNFNLVQHAVAENNVEALQYFIEEKGCDYSMVSSEFQSSLLEISSLTRSLRVTKYLVKVLHMDPTWKDHSGWTLLHFASFIGHLEALKFLKDFFQPYKEIQNYKSDTPLSLAVFKGHTDVVQFLIENSMYDPDCKLLDRDSYLHIISYAGNFSALKLLLKTSKFDVHSHNKHGQTPLMIACFGGHLELAKYFIETHHSDPITVDILKNNALHYSAHVSLDLVKYLVEELNLNPKTKGCQNKEPLHMASENGKLDIVEYLVLEHKCDPSIRADKSVSALHYAACRGHLPVLKFLISHGCNPFTVDDSNNTPLHVAALCGTLEIIKYYVEELHDSLKPHYDGAISLARQKQQHEVVSYLESQRRAMSTTAPVSYTLKQILTMMMPFDESHNALKYQQRKILHKTPPIEDTAILNFLAYQKVFDEEKRIHPNLATVVQYPQY